MPVELTPVSSSNIDAVGHDAAENELHVRFVNGSTHVYSGVDAEQHQALLDAPSLGGHFAARIRINHPSRKL